jgi:hypothetical protein
MVRCGKEEPALTDVEGRLVACHLYDRGASQIAIEVASGVSPVPSV